MTIRTETPWTDIEELLASGDGEALRAYLRDLERGELARALARLDDEDQAEALAFLPPAEAAELVAGLTDFQAADMLEELEPGVAAAILHELSSNDQADVIQELDRADAEAILEALEPGEARSLRQLASYPPDVAGGVMVTEYLAFPADATAAQVVTDLRRNAETYRDYQVQYLYVTDRKDRLVGVLRLHDLLMSPPDEPLRSLMIADPASVGDLDGLDEIQEVFDRRKYLGVPVVDGEGHLLGVIRRGDLLEALAERAGSDYLKSQGVTGGDELRSAPVLRRAGRRLSWLSVNILLNMLAASVIAFYEDTLSAVIALAVFLPIISDMSGCSGNQAAAVTMRELTLGLVRPRELLRTWWSEVSVGVLTGLVLGTLLGLAAWLWRGDPFLGLVVGCALAINTLVAVSLGGTLPLFLRRFGFDPALASGPILTTVTDLCGFFLALSFATAMLAQLTG